MKNQNKSETKKWIGKDTSSSSEKTLKSPGGTTRSSDVSRNAQGENRSDSSSLQNATGLNKRSTFR